MTIFRISNQIRMRKLPAFIRLDNCPGISIDIRFKRRSDYAGVTAQGTSAWQVISFQETAGSEQHIPYGTACAMWWNELSEACALPLVMWTYWTIVFSRTPWLQPWGVVSSALLDLSLPGFYTRTYDSSASLYRTYRLWSESRYVLLLYIPASEIAFASLWFLIIPQMFKCSA